MFIAIEGADGVGTTTQAALLATWFRQKRGRQVVETCEPTAGPYGKRAREVLAGGAPSAHGWQALALAFAADRLHHLEHEILPALSRGDVVITDRYFLSSLVYQSLHSDTAWVAELNRHARDADHTFVVSLGVDEAMARLQKRASQKEVYENLELQTRVHALYQQIGARRAATFIDGAGKKEDVLARITERL